MAEFAAIWREMPKFVYSTTLESAEWNTTIVRDLDPEEVLQLKAHTGGDLVVGGADLAAGFMRHDLIDELVLFVHPVVIGVGNPLFPGSTGWIRLDLTDTRRFGNGVVTLRYRVSARGSGS